MAESTPLPAGAPVETATWDQTPLVVRHWVLQLLALLQQQAERIQTLEARITELEARVQQRSHNSDRPPSSDPSYEKRPARAGTPGKPGAKPGHRGHQPAQLASTEVIEVKPAACACGQTACLDSSPSYTHQVIELPEIGMIVRHFVLYEAYCPQCGKVTKAQVPPQGAAGQGTRLTALIGEWSGSQRGSRSAVQAFCASVLGVRISRGAIQRVADQVSEAIHLHYGATAAKAREAKVHYIDETSWDQHGVLAWLWVMVNTTVALFQVHASWNTAAFKALSKRWAGILVSDGDGGYCLSSCAPDVSGASDPPRPRIVGAEGPGAGLVWAPRAGRVATVSALSHSTPDGWGGEDLVCAPGPPAEPA